MSTFFSTIHETVQLVPIRGWLYLPVMPRENNQTLFFNYFQDSNMAVVPVGRHELPFIDALEGKDMEKGMHFCEDVVLCTVKGRFPSKWSPFIVLSTSDTLDILESEEDKDLVTSLSQVNLTRCKRLKARRMTSGEDVWVFGVLVSNKRKGQAAHLQRDLNGLFQVLKESSAESTIHVYALLESCLSHVFQEGKNPWRRKIPILGGEAACKPLAPPTTASPLRMDSVYRALERISGELKDVMAEVMPPDEAELPTSTPLQDFLLSGCHSPCRKEEEEEEAEEEEKEEDLPEDELLPDAQQLCSDSEDLFYTYNDGAAAESSDAEEREEEREEESQTFNAPVKKKKGRWSK